MVCNRTSFLYGGFHVLVYFAFTDVRKIFNFILLFCLLVYIGGYQLLYILYQKGLKTEMKTFIKQNRTVEFGTRFVFSINAGKVIDPDFKWEEENEEFTFQTELYDVVSIEKKNEKVEIVCLKDHDENHLELQYREIQKLNKPNSSKKTPNSIKFFSVFYFQKQSSIDSQFFEKINKVFCSCSKLVSTTFEIKSPPPRC